VIQNEADSDQNSQVSSQGSRVRRPSS